MTGMRLDHLSYACGPDGCRATVERLSAALGAEFVDGGVHPRFGTVNHILPLENDRYIEVVDVLDHPASDKAPFGQAVRARKELGGGWLGWVVAVRDMERMETRLEQAGGPRQPAPPRRAEPDLAADRREGLDGRPAAAVLHPLGRPRRAPVDRRQGHQALRPGDRRMTRPGSPTGSVTLPTTSSTTSTSPGSARTVSPAWSPPSSAHRTGSFGCNPS